MNKRAKNQNGSTLVLSLVLLSFGLLLSSYLMTQMMQKHRMSLQHTFSHGYYEIGIDLANLFVSTSSQYHYIDLVSSSEFAGKGLMEDQLKVLVHAKQYLKEAESYLQYLGGNNTQVKVQDYYYSMGEKEAVGVQNRVYSNNKTKQIDRIKDVVKPVIVQLTDYEEVKKDYTSALETIAELVDAPIVHEQENDLIYQQLQPIVERLQHQLGKPYQFLLYTQVVQTPTPNSSYKYGMEQSIVSLLTYKFTDEGTLKYNLDNQYTLRNNKEID